MKVYRISAEKYSEKLTSSGSANRWNKDGQFVIYTGSSRSLSSLELIVHRAAIKPTVNYKVMIIEAYSKLQNIGSAWYLEQRSLALKVPSAIIPQEYNYIINMKHPEFKGKVKLLKVEDYF